MLPVRRLGRALFGRRLSGRRRRGFDRARRSCDWPRRRRRRPRSQRVEVIAEARTAHETRIAEAHREVGARSAVVGIIRPNRRREPYLEVEYAMIVEAML